MNINLPGENGLELTRKIKINHSSIIVVILTSYDSPEYRELAIQYKADFFLSKDSIATGKMVQLVKSILLEQGFSGNGSIGESELRRERKTMPLIRKRKIWWDSIPEANSYIVYVSNDETVFEPERFSWESTPGIISKPVIEKTEIIIPDEWPEFPEEPGTYFIGITSRDELGNQSEPLILSGLFRFIAPPAPKRGGIEYL